MATETEFKKDITAMKETMESENPELSIDERVAISMAVSEYHRSSEQFNAVSTRFNNACSSLRSTLGANRKLVVKVDFTTYLVTSDDKGNFDVEAIPSI